MTLAPRPRELEAREGRCALATLRESVAVDAEAVAERQGYVLTLEPGGVSVLAHDAAGAFYGRQTLTQLRGQVDADGSVGCGVIRDWPDFLTRGLMVDISRDRVPTMAGLYGLVDRLALLKVNQLQLYTEHTFAYAGHEAVWSDASPMTAEEVLALQAYCKERFVELVPNQNCFGHLERWLKHGAYRGLAECPDGFVRDDLPEPFFSPDAKTLNPLDAGSLALVEDVLGQLLPLFDSAFVNVGCDETFDLGKGASKEACEREGKGRVYLDFVRKVCEVCRKHGKRMQFWGDIVLHYPELLPAVRAELPGAVALTWGYELDHPFDEEASAFAAAGLDYMVCPSTSTFVGIGGRSDVAVGNAVKACEAGLKHGAMGVLNTWWGDFGHWQAWATNDPGILMGASASWCLEANRGLDVAGALDALVFSDAAGRLGEAVMELGRVRDDLACNRDNVLGWALIRDEAALVEGDVSGEWWLGLPWGKTGPVTESGLAAVRARVDRVLAAVALADPKRSDGGLLVEELAIAGRMLAHSASDLSARMAHGVGKASALPAEVRAGLHGELSGIVSAYESAWLRRSRPGGLADSVASLRRVLAGYGDGDEMGIENES